MACRSARSPIEPGDAIVRIDFRESDAQLFGVGQSGRPYTIHPVTGVATVVGASPWAPLAGTQFGVDFNPQTHQLRVTSDADIVVRALSRQSDAAATR